MAERMHIGGDAGRHVDAYVNAELKKKYKGKKMPKTFMEIADAEDRAEMRDPEAIMGNVSGSTDGYRARQALEDEDRRDDSSEVTMLDLFNKPHGFTGGRSGMKAIKAGKPRRGRR